MFSGLGQDACAETPGPHGGTELGAGQDRALMGPSGITVMGAAEPPGLAGPRGVRSAGAARGRDLPAG